MADGFGCLVALILMHDINQFNRLIVLLQKFISWILNIDPFFSNRKRYFVYYEMDMDPLLELIVEDTTTKNSVISRFTVRIIASLIKISSQYILTLQSTMEGLNKNNTLLQRDN